MTIDREEASSFGMALLTSSVFCATNVSGSGVDTPTTEPQVRELAEREGLAPSRGESRALA